MPDARLLANLAFVRINGRVLDPFAGAGGILIEAARLSSLVYTTDVDPFVMHGLHHLGGLHSVADARTLPFPDAVFQSIASELPFDPDCIELAGQAVANMFRVLMPGGKIAIMVGQHQAEAARISAASAGLIPILDSLIDRKGLSVNVLVWEKSLQCLPESPIT